jgi:parallel beta-helix repeat protein
MPSRCARRDQSEAQVRVVGQSARMLVAALLAVTAWGAPAWAKVCPTSIAACGCEITSSGFYQVTAALSSSQGTTLLHDCIDVRAPSVVLFLGGFAITGPGASSTPALSAGLHLFPKATGTFIAGGDSQITGWGYGVDDEANTVVGLALNLSNDLTGLYVAGAAGTTFSELAANDNTTDGVLLYFGNGNNISNCTADGNGKAGVELEHTKGNSVNNCTVSSNTGYGVWVRGSNNNQIYDLSADTNDFSGIYVGCSGSGKLGSSCPKVAPSTSNLIYDLEANSNFGAGIAIDTGDTGNLVTFNRAAGNSPDGTDENANCDSNSWFGDTFVSTSQSCIH